MSMPHSRTVRILFVGSLIVAIVGVIALSAWLLWPTWQRYWAVRQLVEAGKAREHDRCLDAVEAIDKLQDDVAVADDLLDLMKHPDDGVRIYAIIGLAAIQPRPKAAVQRLIAVLDDTSEAEAVRATAAISLGMFGVEAKEALPSLKIAGDSSNHKISSAAIGGYQWIINDDSQSEIGHRMAFLSDPPREIADWLLHLADEFMQSDKGSARRK